MFVGTFDQEKTSTPDTLPAAEEPEKKAPAPVPAESPEPAVQEVQVKEAQQPEIETPEPPAEEQIASAAKEPIEQPPEKTPAPPPETTEPEKPEPKPRTKSYPLHIGKWLISKVDDGCMAILPVKGAPDITNIEQPESVGMYLFHAKAGLNDEDGPDRYGFVAPGRGEMSAKLTSKEGAYVRGVNSNTGLFWSSLVQEARNGMDLELTVCNLEGVCKTHKKKLDIADLEAASNFTYKCARDD